MPKITSKSLRKRVDKIVKVKREGIVGNSLEKGGKIREGSLIGILKEDGEGFYVKMFKPYWKNHKIHYHDSSFLEKDYRIQDRDNIILRTGNTLVNYLFMK